MFAMRQEIGCKERLQVHFCQTKTKIKTTDVETETRRRDNNWTIPQRNVLIVSD